MEKSERIYTKITMEPMPLFDAYLDHNQKLNWRYGEDAYHLYSTDSLELIRTTMLLGEEHTDRLELRVIKEEELSLFCEVKK